MWSDCDILNTPNLRTEFGAWQLVGIGSVWVKPIAWIAQSCPKVFNLKARLIKISYVSCLVQTLGPWRVGSILCSSWLVSSSPTLFRLRLWLAKTGSELSSSSVTLFGSWPEACLQLRSKPKQQNIKRQCEYILDLFALRCWSFTTDL